MPPDIPAERFDVGLPAAHQSRPDAFPAGIVRPISFETPDRLTDVISWHGHIPFAFWVIEALRPRVFVELGTHKGDSYCAFAQAVDRLGLGTLCYAIDTWRGDEHAGFYGEEVFDELRQYHDSRYGRFSRLVRSTFDDAVSRFGDGSIDLLHIDGLHTYEAVKHDFETWRPKLSNRGVVLFHDINVRESDFGVWRLWDELACRFPSFAFRHSHGLGVLAVSADVAAPIRHLTRYAEAEAEQVRVFFSRLSGTLALKSENSVARAALATREMELLAAQQQVQQSRLQREQFEHELTDLRAENQRLIANVESLRTENAMLIARAQQQLNTHDSLLEESHRLWSSSSWRLLRPLRNLIRGFHGYDRETEPIPASQAEALRTIIAIRDSLSWELTTPLRIVHRVLSPRSASPAPPVKSKWEKADFLLIERDADFDLEFFLPPSAPRLSRDEAIEGFMRGWAVEMGRKPYSGFNPQIYAELAMKPKEREKRNPLAHFIENAKPAGPWLIPLIRQSAQSPGATRLRTAIHVHAYYPELMEELLRGLSGNASKCDLFVTTSRQEDLERLKHSTASYDRGDVRISIVPNRGRDIGPFVTEYAWLSEKYELVGHLHSKKTAWASAEVGETWRRFLWGNLVGEGYPMMDVIAKHFENDPHLGLVFPDDPHLFGWTRNRECAARLAQKMGLTANLPLAFEFPAGTMFWCRGAALRPLFDLGLTWDDYPPEPLPEDGTILHAIERLLPFIAQHQGYRLAATYTPGLRR